MAVRLTDRRSVVVISDWIEGPHRGHASDNRRAALPTHATDPASRPWSGDGSASVDVTGGYLERMPLALVAATVVVVGRRHAFPR